MPRESIPEIPPSAVLLGPGGAPVPANVRYPVRAAAIDVGSNAIRYVVAEVSETGKYTEVESERLAVRLGGDVFTKARTLSPTTLQMAVDALSRIRRRLDDLGIAHYRAVATSAVRESANGGELVDRVRRECGLHLETISGSEEARLVWLAVGDRIDFGGDRWFLMDLGGGSLEVSVVDREGILWSESHTLGTVRLLNAFQEEEGRVDGKDYRDLLERYVHGLRVPAAIADWEPVATVATGGNIEALADLAGAPLDEATGVPRLGLKELRRVLDQLVGLDMEERISELGLRQDRADVIVPAAVVYERVADLAGAEEILVPGVGVKEGLVRDLVEGLRDSTGRSGRREREVHAAALALGRRCRFDEAHARQVAKLSLSLFDQMGELHGFGERERLVLLAAALLHDIGQFISYRRHHKHSMYLIGNSELSGLSPDEVQLVATIARYHRRAEPRLDHEEFARLSDRGREVVRRLAAILRVADALDREHVARVSSLDLVITGTEVVLEVETTGPLALEEWALRKKGRLFGEVFGRSPAIRSSATTLP